jgi:predicted amino acid dehydrogenase
MSGFLHHMWPITLSRITGLRELTTGREVSGWIIAVPITAERLLTDHHTAKKRIIQALKLAEKRGCGLVGLGALLPALTRYGKTLQVKTSVSLTNGHALTTWALRETSSQLLTILGISEREATIAILGAWGSIGSGTAHLLARCGVRKLILIDRPRVRGALSSFQHTLESLSPGLRVQISTDKSDVQEADLIITATNSPGAVLTSADLPPGSIVLNDAQPSDVAQEVESRADVLILEGGLVTLANVDTHGVLGLPRKEDVFGCLGETMVLAAHGWQGDYMVGKLDPAFVERIGQLARAIGVKAAPLQTTHKLITEEDLRRIKGIRQSSRRRTSFP